MVGIENLIDAATKINYKSIFIDRNYEEKPKGQIAQGALLKAADLILRGE